MKFFYKMFLGMTVILAVALGMIEYVTLSYFAGACSEKGAGQCTFTASDDKILDWKLSYLI